jgi:ABC-2 type transport system ATP-binding protein
MIVVENLRRLYGDVVAVDDVSFRAGEGVVFGLLGPNGAGKSTVINCISGLLKPSAGQVIVAGFDILREPRKARSALGVVPQELALYEDLPAVENLRYWGAAYGLKGPELKTRVDEVLGYIGLGDRAKDLPRTFSGGMKRRLNFGCGIVHRPRVLLLDEPTVGVDPQSRERLFAMVEQQRDAGACVLYTTHYMEEAERLCNELVIVDHGRVLASGTVAGLRAKLGERDTLLLTGNFPDGAAARAVGQLAGGGLGDLEIIAAADDSLGLTLTDASRHLAAIFQALAAAGATVDESTLRRPNLETLFLKLTGKELRAT